jgi:hypothetical protein
VETKSKGEEASGLSKRQRGWSSQPSMFGARDLGGKADRNSNSNREEEKV